MGIEAETRITPAETKPNCPFPATITIGPASKGGVNIAVPIDLPFTEINKIVEAQFAGKTFPEDGSGSVDVTVKKASVAASGDRLLFTLLVYAKEKKSFFGFGAEAYVHIWGVPALDRAQQTLRLDNIELAVESEAAFGPARRRRARGDAAAAARAGGEGQRRPETVRRQCAARRSPPPSPTCRRARTACG